jgi:hypothetical protein
METTKNHNIPNKGVQDSFMELESLSYKLRLRNEPSNRKIPFKNIQEILS